LIELVNAFVKDLLTLATVNLLKIVITLLIAVKIFMRFEAKRLNALLIHLF